MANKFTFPGEFIAELSKDRKTFELKQQIETNDSLEEILNNFNDTENTLILLTVNKIFTSTYIDNTEPILGVTPSTETQLDNAT